MSVSAPCNGYIDQIARERRRALAIKNKNKPKNISKAIRIPAQDLNKLEDKLKKYLNKRPEIKYTKKIYTNGKRYVFDTAEDKDNVFLDVFFLGKK